jgi:hypothetical protein
VSLSDKGDKSIVHLAWNTGEMPIGTTVLNPEENSGLCAAQFIIQTKGGLLAPQWDSIEIVFPTHSSS